MMSATSSPSASASVLFEVQAPPLGPAGSAAALSVRGPRIVCLKQAGVLVRGCVEPSLFPQSRFLLAGRTPERVLLQGEAGYVPSVLSGGEDLRVQDFLRLGALLIGRSRGSAREEMRRFHLETIKTLRLPSLSPVQQRMVSLAQANLGQPRILLLDDPYRDLSDADAAVLSHYLSPLLDSTLWIAAVSTDSPLSRSLADRASHVVDEQGRVFSGSFFARQADSKDWWVCSAQLSPAFREALEAVGAQVSEGLHAGSWHVRRVSSATLLNLAQQTSTPLFSLSPAGWGARSHAIERP